MSELTSTRVRTTRRSNDEAAALELVDRLRTHDHTAFEPLMRRYNALVFRTARAVLASHADAEDCAQHVWMKVYRQIGAFEGRSNLSTWIGKITYHVAIDMKRNRGHQGEQLDAIENHASLAPSPEQSVIGSQTIVHLEEAITELAPPLREVFMLRDVSGAAVSEVADILGLSAENVRVRSHRARQEVGRKLSRSLAAEDAFNFDGERCDRIVLRVHQALGLSIPFARNIQERGAGGSLPGRRVDVQMR